ncbi:MAG: hypothetical protein HRT74_02230 [Flavobacteriales bacterium]|nr:hypothetical protein [Flavobacteriales bacterium]
MIRLLKLELLKARPAKFFWILLGIYGAILISIPIGVIGLGEKLSSLLPNEYQLSNMHLFFDFQDIWQNITFLLSYITYFFLNALIIIFVAREFSLKTARQNVIDGLSKSEFVWGKVIFITFLALMVSILVFLIALIFGLILSPSVPFDLMIDTLDFIPVYFLHVLQSLSFGMFLAVLIRRPGIAVVVSFGYYWFDLLASAIVKFPLGSPILGNMFPISSQLNLIPSPFLKFVLLKTETSPDPMSIAISLGWIVLQFAFCFWFVKKRNL